MARDYAIKWVHSIEDVTPLVKELSELRRAGEYQRAEAKLPVERPTAQCAFASRAAMTWLEARS